MIVNQRTNDIGLDSMVFAIAIEPTLNDLSYAPDLRGKSADLSEKKPGQHIVFPVELGEAFLKLTLPVCIWLVNEARVEKDVDKVLR